VDVLAIWFQATLHCAELWAVSFVEEEDDVDIVLGAAPLFIATSHGR
jgi:hypothetical protein